MLFLPLSRINGDGTSRQRTLALLGRCFSARLRLLGAGQHSGSRGGAAARVG
jgi:hypothetical protein